MSGETGAAPETDEGAEPLGHADSTTEVADQPSDGPPAAAEGNGAADVTTQSDDELIEAALRGDAARVEPELVETETVGTEPVHDDEAVADEDGGPVPRREERRAVRSEARRVRRVVRKVDPWSVLKVSLIFYACMYVIVMVAAVLLWSAAASSGTVDNIEDFVVDLGFSDFQFQADQMFRAALFGGAILMVVGTGFTVLCSVLFNMISDLVGGIRVTMIEQVVDGRRSADEQASAPR